MYEDRVIGGSDTFRGVRQRPPIYSAERYDGYQHKYQHEYEHEYQHKRRQL